MFFFIIRIYSGLGHFQKCQVYQIPRKFQIIPSFQTPILQRKENHIWTWFTYLSDRLIYVTCFSIYTCQLFGSHPNLPYQIFSTSPLVNAFSCSFIVITSSYLYVTTNTWYYELVKSDSSSNFTILEFLEF